MTATTWADEAACIDTPRSMFFPDDANSYGPARRLCGRCVVRDECLSDALGVGDVQFGMRGGMDPDERKSLLRTRQQARRARA
jgi:WhiB family redox-sensing transcriptional regulator